MTHLELRGRWQQVLITDNPFKQVRVSPYAFTARIAHDVPEVHPTVVCSTRDRNGNERRTISEGFASRARQVGAGATSASRRGSS